MRKMLKYWILGALALAIVFIIGFNSRDSKLKASEDDGTTTAQEQQQAKEESSKKVEVVKEKREETEDRNEEKGSGEDEEEDAAYEVEETYSVELGGELPYDDSESEVVLVAEDVIGAEAGYFEEEVISEEEILSEEVLTEEEVIAEEEVIEEAAEEPVEVEIKMNKDGDVYYGDKIVLEADIKGKPNDGYRIIWQCKTTPDADWEEIGEGMTYDFVVTEENATYEYRVILVH